MFSECKHLFNITVINALMFFFQLGLIKNIFKCVHNILLLNFKMYDVR